MSANENKAVPTFLSAKEVADMLQISKPTLWRWVNEGRLPGPVRLSERILRWRLTDIEEHVDQMTEQVT